MGYYSIAQISKLFGLSDRTLRSRLKDGTLVGEKINGKWMISSERIYDFISSPQTIPTLRTKVDGVYSRMFTSSDNGRKASEYMLLCRFHDAIDYESEKVIDLMMKASENSDIHFYRFVQKRDLIYIIKGEYSVVRKVINELYSIYIGIKE
ncbi:MAG: helix-turn-helix domain-containing protein [Clostridia bacterium]|nr:helix-turn-helix domain-containing protein [Clostridia bacterium]